MRRLLLFLIPILAIVVIVSSAGIYTEWLWYVSVGYVGIFWKMITSRIVAGLVVGLLTFVFVYANLLLLRRTLRARVRGTPTESNIRYFPSSHGYMDAIDDFLASKYVTGGLLGITLVLAILWGLGATAQWLDVQFFLNRTDFGIADPIFNQDVGYYVFQLPFLLYLYRTFMGLVIFVLLGSGGLYFLSGLLSRQSPGGKGAIAHVSGLLAAALGMKAWGYKLTMDQLVYSPRGVAFGASYTDVHASLPIFRLLFWLSIALAIGAIANLWLRRYKLTMALPVVLMLLSAVVGSIYPGFIQKFNVEPNELVRETPFIENNIRFTRLGFGLDKIVERQLPAPAVLTPEKLENNELTVDNIRLLDWRFLNQTYSQLQGMRPYYRFQDIDIDRYMIDGELRQVMLSLREMSVENLQPTAQTWINQHLVYTHGYGAVVSPVNKIDEQGQPVFWVGDIPPRSQHPELEITVPQIYFGERTNNYIVVNTTTPEFDFPQGSEANATTFYQGDDGIKLGFFNKLMFSLRFGTAKLFLADSVTPESRIVFHRNIYDRVNTIAPFLTYEDDAYAVIHDGRIYWVIDAYTTSSWFPYSEPHRGVNYIRNSIKVVIDAYNGTTTYYVVDEEDPIAATLGKIFPDILRPFAEMPEGLQRHIRYPESFLAKQAQVLTVYQMQDPTLFYNKEDLWKFAQEKWENTEPFVQPYYMVMRLPDKPEAEEEFVLVLPLTPAGTRDNERHNMVAWLVARNDGDNYGEIVLYRFPKETVVQGPMQIEARIDQNTEISANISLWNQSGSRVVRGNLLVIPIEDSILYVEPLYMLASGTNLPELKQVIVATRDRVVMRETLGEALAALVGRAPARPTQPGEQPPTDVDSTWQQLAQQIDRVFQQAQQAQREGNWAEYGRLLEQLDQLIRSLGQRVGP